MTDAGPAAGPGSLRGLALMRDLLISLPAAVAYVAGPDLVFEFANDGYRAIAGARDLIGRPYREAMPELGGQPQFEALRRVLRTGRACRSREAKAWLRGPDTPAEQIFLDAVYQPVRDEAGRVAGVLIFGADVSEHVRGRQRLQEVADGLARSEERSRALFETLPQAVIHYRRDGSVIRSNRAAAEILGGSPDEMTPVDRARRTVHEDGTPFRPGDLPAMVALRTGDIVSGVVAGVHSARTGELRWVRITAVPDARDADGQPQGTYAIFTDITERRRATLAQRQSSRLLERLRDSGVLGVVASTEAGVYDANDAFLDMIGYSREDVRAGRLSYQAVTPPEWAGHDQAALAQLWSAGAFHAYEKEYLRRDGQRVPVLVGGVVVDRSPLRWVTLVADLSAPQRAARERAESRAREQAARVEAESARERLALLLGAGDLLAAAGSRREMLDLLAQLVVPVLSDSCVVFLPAGQGMLRAEAVAHRDPALAAALEGLRTIDIPAAGPLMLQAAFSQGAIQLTADVTAVAAGWARAPREVADLLKRACPQSAVATPLPGAERPAGVMLLGRGGGRPRFTETDMAVIGELARRLAAGLANVEMFAREHTVAETLQHALLPDSLPRIQGLDLAVRYLPATGGVHVGGDWYDAFALAGGRVGLAIGDVTGHSITSASIMGQVRTLIRAFAMSDASPASVLRRVNAAVAALLPEAFATVFYAVLDLPGGDFAYANAGHPPPLLRDGDGRAEYLDRSCGPMLGAAPGAAFPAFRRRLPPGAVLLMYTDGLVEDRRRDIGYGLRALAAAFERAQARTAAEVTDSIHGALLGATARDDDVCVFAARLTG